MPSAYPPKVVFEPSLEGYVNLFTTRTRVSPEELEALPPNRHNFGMRNRAQPGHGHRRPVALRRAVPELRDHRLRIDLPVDLSRNTGGLRASPASRCRLKDDLLFFILSTRMMPPIAVAIPIFLMYRDARPVGHPSRHDPALYGREHLAWRSGS